MKISDIKRIILYAYLVVILGLFPLYFRLDYVEMGEGKYNFFLYSSVAAFSMLLLATVVQFIFTAEQWNALTGAVKMLDISVMAYFVIVLLSYLFSPYKSYITYGAYEWYMGLISQIIFFLCYLFMSREYEHRQWVLYVLYGVSGLVFLLGYLHRFYIDPLGLYTYLTTEQKLQFLSTIGQSTWYSGYMCTVMPLGIYDYFAATGKRRLFMGFYVFIAAATLVTQNSDTAYVALVGMLLVLLYKASRDRRDMLRFTEVCLIILSAFKLTGLLQLAVGCIPELDSLSISMSQGALTWVLWAVVLGIYLYMKFKLTPKEGSCRWVFFVALLVVGLSVLLLLILIILNTLGYISPALEGEYFTWNASWGNNRGVEWTVGLVGYGAMPSLIHYLIGMGPDAFEPATCSVEKCVDLLDTYLGDTRLTNAHNDFITTLVNEGAFGLIAYVSIFVNALRAFLKQRKSCLTAGIAMCVAAYGLHNFFCYQNACNTPFFYILLGMGANLAQKEEN